MSIQWSGGFDFGPALQQLAAAADHGTQLAGEHVLKASQAAVPVESGDLRDSGKVTTERQGDETVVSVSYDTVYAVRQHEDLDDQHERGGAKFLERPLNEEAPATARIIADTVRKAVR